MDAQPSAAGARTSPSARRPIGEFLVERGLVTPEELAAALQQQRASGKRLGEILVERGAITRMALASVLGEQWEEAGRHLRAVVPVRLADGKEADSGLAGGEELTESLSSLQAAVVRLEELAGEVVDAPRAAPDAGAVGEVVARLERIEAWMQDGAGGALGEQLAAAVEGLGRELAEIKVVLAQPIAADDALAERLGRLEDALEYRPDDTIAERLGALDEWLRSRDDGALGETMRAALEELGGELRALAAREPERDPVLAERLDRIEQALARESATDARFDRLEALVQEAARSDAGVEPLRAELAELRTAVAAALSPVVEVDARLAGIEEALATRSAERLEERLAELARATAAADETVAERLARIETGLAERPTVEPGGAIVASALAGLRERIDELAARPDRLPPELSHALAELRGSLQMPARDEELHARLDELAGLLAARSVDAPIPAEVAEALAELRERVAAAPRAEELDERLGVLAAAVEAAAAPDGELRSRLERIETALGEISVPEATAEVTAALAELRERLDAVGEHATAPDLRDALDRIDGRLGQALAPDSELRERLASLESLVASVAERDLGHRLDELHAALQRSAEPDSDVRARLARIETALAERDSDGSFAVFAGALAEVGGGLDELREALGKRETAGADEEVRGRLEHIEQVLDHIPTADVAARVEDLARIVAEVRDAPTRPAEPDHELRERVDRLAAALHEHGADTRVLDAIAALAASLPHVPDAGEIGWRVAEVLTPRLERLEAQSGELGQALERLGELQAAPAAEIAERVAAALAGDQEALRALVASVAPHDVAAVAETVVAGLDERLTGLADDLRGRVEGLRSELSARSHEPAAGTIADRVTGALGERLDRLEGAVADRSVEKALAARFETLPDELAGRVREAVPKPPQAGEIAKRVESRLAERLEGIEAAVRERPELELIEGLQARLDDVSSRLSESRDGELLEQLGRIEHELGAAGAAVREGLEGRREQLDGVSAAVGRVDGELARRLDELVGGIEAAVRAAVPDERLTELVERIEGVRSAIHEPRDGAVHERLDAQAAQLAEVREVLARLGSALADRRDDARVERLEELAAELRDALADPPGAAALTRLMTQSHNALADRLESIESSVASLPPIVPSPQSPPALPRTAEPVPVPSPSVEPVGSTSYVAIVPSADGYSLVGVDGPLPEPGGTLDLEEAGGPLVVARIGRSPLPGDRRRCAFLEAG